MKSGLSGKEQRKMGLLKFNLGVPFFLAIITILCLTNTTKAWETLKHIEDRKNLWVTWAEKTNQSSLCLSMATPSDPFRTCLLGVPINMSLLNNSTITLDPLVISCGSLSNLNPPRCNKENITFNASSPFMKCNSSMCTTTREIQEFNLLGSAPSDRCFNFSEHGNQDDPINVTSYRPYNITAYCQNITEVTTVTSRAGRLPEGMFLICGDRAWQGIPRSPQGGPCYIGRLTLFTPSITNIFQANRTTAPHRAKRALVELGADCKDDVELWSPPEVILASIFAPGVATAQALTQLRKLACWTGKQINITTNILSELASDVQGIRHALLQNRAAIDFLLLAQGHGCEEFEGMCCMNLSDHSSSIHKQLSILRDNMGKLRESTDPFMDWLSSLGLSGWWVTIIEKTIIIAVVVLLLILLLPCIFQCFQKLMINSVKRVLMVQQKGGDDGDDLFHPERTSSETRLIEGGLWEMVKNGPQDPAPSVLRRSA